MSWSPSAAQPEPGVVAKRPVFNPDRLNWLLELMGRYARERAESHDSPRLAAAVVIHLRALESEVPEGTGLAATIEHWLELWEDVLDRALARHTPVPGASLFELVRRARRTPA